MPSLGLGDCWDTVSGREALSREKNEQTNPNQPEKDRLIRLLAAANRHRDQAVRNADYGKGCRFRDLANLLEGRIALLRYLDSL